MEIDNYFNLKHKVDIINFGFYASDILASSIVELFLTICYSIAE